MEVKRSLVEHFPTGEKTDALQMGEYEQSVVFRTVLYTRFANRGSAFHVLSVLLTG